MCVGVPAPPLGSQWLRVAAVRLPRISNSTDVEALACEPGVTVRWASGPAQLADADVVVIPGSKATVADLQWLRDRGLADAIVAHARRGGVVLGICGGLQMLCRQHRRRRRKRPGHRCGPGSARRRHRVRRTRRCCGAGRRRPTAWTATRSTTDRVLRCAEDAWFEVGGSAQGYRSGAVFAHPLARAVWTTTTSGGPGCSRPPRQPAGPDSGWRRTSAWRLAVTRNSM